MPENGEVKTRSIFQYWYHEKKGNQAWVGRASYLGSVVAKPDAVEHDTDHHVDGGEDYGYGHAQLPGRAGCELPLLHPTPSTEHHQT